jgi:exopolyphosphatase/guanosine-5'-triphosphate,3'-diphosphate pyrophosphatase
MLSHPDRDLPKPVSIRMDRESAGMKTGARAIAPAAPVKAARDERRWPGIRQSTIPRAQDGRLDHHKDKKGRKRRRRGVAGRSPSPTCGGQSPRRPAAKPTPAPDADTGQPAPPRASAAAAAQTACAMAQRRGRGHGLAPVTRPQRGRPPAAASSGPRRSGAHRRASPAAGYYAALDLGTNNCRLLVATPTRPGQFRVVDAFSRIVRLGEGLSRTGRLSDAAMDRAIEALKVCRDKLETRPSGACG